MGGNSCDNSLVINLHRSVAQNQNWQVFNRVISNTITKSKLEIVQ